MKKIIVTLLAIIIVFSALPVIYAAETDPTFEAISASGKRGDTVSVEIKLKNNPGITALQLNIGYSAADLELLSVANGGVFNNPISCSTLSANPIIISWFATDSSDAAVDGTIAVLTFKIRDNANSSNINISYNPDNVFNSAFDNVYFDTINGSVTVKDKALTNVIISKLPDKTTYSVGESFDATGLQLLAEYDDGTSSIVTEGYTVSGFSSSTPGEKTVTVFYQDITATFSVVVEEPLLPTFEVDSIDGKRGEIVEVGIRIMNNPGITALQLNVDYSDSDLELVSIVNGGVFDEPISFSSLDAKPFVISWYAADSTNRTDNGTLAILRFKILDGAKTNTILLSYDEDNVFDISFENIHFEKKSGSIRVSLGLLGDVDDSDDVDIVDVTLIQRYLALMSIQRFNEALADIDADDEITIIDATFMQRYLALMPVPFSIDEPLYIYRRNII